MTPSIGRIVHVKVAPHHMIPAIVVADWGGGCINVQAFPDGLNTLGALQRDGGSDGHEALKAIEQSHGGPCWLLSINEGTEPGDWCWPPRS